MLNNRNSVCGTNPETRGRRLELNEGDIEKVRQEIYLEYFLI
jgi:hypothetical protein